MTAHVERERCDGEDDEPQAAAPIAAGRDASFGRDENRPDDSDRGGRRDSETDTDDSSNRLGATPIPDGSECPQFEEEPKTQVEITHTVWC
jgi:hypothetical protein